jgi:hypothetical protein
MSESIPNFGTLNRDVEINGLIWSTNLPEGIDLLSTESSSPLDINPSALDELPLGETYFTRDIEQEVEFGEVSIVQDKRVLNITEGKKGRVFGPVIETGSVSETASFPPTLIEALGYEKDEYGIVLAAPTPNTLKASAAELGVDVEFFPEYEEIPSKDYLGAYAEGKYPISTKHRHLYLHDIGDAHLTSAIVGGEELKSLLQKAAAEALASGDEEVMKTAAQFIDQFTGTLRAVALYPLSQPQSAFGNDRAKDVLYSDASKAGISKEDCDRLLQSCKKRAEELGIEVREFI